MKKLNQNILVLMCLFVLSIFASCNDDDNNSPIISNLQITPPQWVQGHWGIVVSGDDMDEIIPTIRFTSDDFYVILNSSTAKGKYSFRNLLKQNQAKGGNVNIDERVSNNEYYLKISVPDSYDIPQGFNLEYRLKKITNQRIQWVNYPSSNNYPEDLIRLKD